MTVLGVIALIYIPLMIFAFMFGLTYMMLYSSEGREDEDFQLGVTCVKYAIIWPYLIYKIIKTRLDEADGGEE